MKKYLLIIASVLVLLLTAYLLLLNEPWKKEETPPPPSVVAEEKPYVSPIDFATLQSKNPDIYGWLDIPGTDISYPLLQSPDDDTFYLDHDEYRDYSVNGSLYTEHSYNTTAFTDAITLVYGHHCSNGRMFGNLQQYFSDPETFDNADTIVVYLPDRELHFHVFAAVPYDNRHIMMTYEPIDPPMVNAFLHTIYDVRTIGANFDDENSAVKDDQLLVLSTCLRGNRQNRYLVVAKLEET